MYHIAISSGNAGGSRLLQQLAKCIINLPACNFAAATYSTTKRIKLKPKQQQQSKAEVKEEEISQLKNPVPAEPSTRDRFSSSREADINFATLNPDKFGDLFEQYGRNEANSSTQMSPSSAVRLAAPLKAESSVPDDEDGYDKLEIRRDARRKSPAAYMRMLNELKRQRPLPVAKILALHQAYVYEERYIPDDTRFYSLLMDVAGKAGFTRKAVELLAEMKRYELRPTKSTVTALFNACANAPLNHPESAEYALQQAHKLREKFQLEGYEFNDIQYNVLVKAFARLGDGASARQMMAEMADKGHSVSLETYAMMLMGCVGNRQTGLLEATRLIHQLLSTSASSSGGSSTPSVKLSLPIVNLFLRTIRDCDLRKEDLVVIASSPLLQSASAAQQPQQQQLTGESSVSSKSSSAEVLNVNKPSSSSDQLQQGNPNLLTGANLNSIVAIDYESLSRPSNRFLLFGGVPGFTALMDAHQIQPSLKTLTLIIDLLPSAEEAIEQVRQLLRRYHLSPDIYLYNVLLKKAAKIGGGGRTARQICQKILQTMQSEYHLQPDIMTFGALTFSCTSARSGRRLLTDMARIGVTPNDKILGSLVNIACSSQDLDYLVFLLEYTETRKVSLSRLDVEQIDLLLKRVRAQIVATERQGVDSVATSSVGGTFKRNYERAAYLFRSRLQTSTIRLNVSPWKQYEPEGDGRPRPSGKAQYNAFVQTMKAKMDIKHRREKRPTVVDYNDEIDD